jgi:diguanylate cyclase (GGDEF)-like protein
MDEHHVSVLLVEDNAGDARLIEMMLDGVRGLPCRIHRAERLADGLQRLGQGGIDVVLLDLGLPDSGGLATVEQTHVQSPDVPIIVLTGHDDEILGVNAVWKGAQDYLVKGEANSSLLGRSIRYAIGRQKLQTAARRSVLVDELTGLLNLRGFSALAQEHLRRARQCEEHRLILIVRLDGLRDLTGTARRHKATEVLPQAANVLRESFRAGDLLARIGADEMAVLTTTARGDDTPDLARDRVADQVSRSNAHRPRAPKLKVSIGVTQTDPTDPATMEQLLAEARKALLSA